MSTNNKQSTKNLHAKLALATALAAATIATATTANAETTGYNQISYSTEVKSQIANNEVQATMYKQVEAKDAKKLATELNTAMNNALVIAKRYPTVTVTTGQNNTYPSYDKRGNIDGWTGRANIDIKSTDLEAASKLIADLQGSLVLGNLNFGVSEDLQDTVKQKLMTEASKSFQQQANTLANAWGASGYQLVKIQLNTGNNYYQPMMMSKVSYAGAESASVPAQNFESGNSTITVTANGTIELIK